MYESPCAIVVTALAETAHTSGEALTTSTAPEYPPSMSGNEYTNCTPTDGKPPVGFSVF